LLPKNSPELHVCRIALNSGERVRWDRYDSGNSGNEVSDQGTGRPAFWSWSGPHNSARVGRVSLTVRPDLTRIVVQRVRCPGSATKYVYRSLSISVSRRERRAKVEQHSRSQEAATRSSLSPS